MSDAGEHITSKTRPLADAASVGGLSKPLRGLVFDRFDPRRTPLFPMQVAEHPRPYLYAGKSLNYRILHLSLERNYQAPTLPPPRSLLWLL